MLRKFLQSRSGNFAILSGVTMVPLCLAAGLAVDYSRHQSAQRHLQEMADATSLALAASKEQNQARLEQVANDYLAANRTSSRVQHVSVASVVATTESVDVELVGSIPTTFMGIAGYQTLDVGASALAERATRGDVEVSLILDNTDSMSDVVGGKTRISVLKSAANDLVSELLKDNPQSVRIGVVPYGQYVNVGLQNRNASWLSVRSDYSTSQQVAEQPAQCTTVDTYKNTTVKRTYDCSYSKDGQWIQRTCTEYNREKTGTKEQCTEYKAAYTKTTNYKWFGCVNSRKNSLPPFGPNRLHVEPALDKYTGFVQTDQNCLTPITPLTNSKATLKSAIDGMVTSVGNHKPLTYIPAGLIWGFNMLTPGDPLDGAGAFDPSNQRPRKVAVLMTDGANTMKINTSNGNHTAISFSGPIDDNTEVPATNAELLQICTNMKAKGIEIFTVGFMMDSLKAKAMLQACSTEPSTHYFDATDSDKLAAAFTGIARSLQVVRLAR